MNSKKTTFSKFSNTIFLITCLFILNFIWINYYLKNFSKSLISTLTIILAFCIIFFPIKSHISHKQNQKNSELISKDNLKQYLYFTKNDTIASLLSNIYNLKKLTQINANHFTTDNKDIFLVFDKEIVLIENFLTMYKSCNTNNLEIYCFSYDKNIKTPNNININFIEFNEIYDLLKKSKANYNINLEFKKSNKFSLKSFFCIAFTKDKAKKYFNLSLLLLFSSLFTPYNIYYIICSTILILFSIYSKFNTKFN